MTCSASIDWAATGTMLQGIGTIIGALAVIAAAAIGGNTFNAWRRQQLVQRHMAIAEKLMTTMFNAREELASARSPLMLSEEMQRAEVKLAESGVDLDSVETTVADRLRRAQAYLLRIDRFRETWKALEESKAAAYAFFGGELPKQIDRILHQVHIYRVNAQELADDNGTDRQLSKMLRSSLTSSRVRGEVDEMAREVDEAVDAIEAKLKPFLQEVATETQKIMAETLKKTLRGMAGIPGLPF